MAPLTTTTTTALNTPRCRASRRLGTVWNFREAAPASAEEPRDGFRVAPPIPIPTAPAPLTRSIARSRSLWTQKQLQRTRQDSDGDSDRPIPLPKRRRNTRLTVPSGNDDLESIRRFDTTTSPAEFWAIDFRLTLLWCLAFEAQAHRHEDALALWIAMIEGKRERVGWAMWAAGDEQWLRGILLDADNPTGMTDRFRLGVAVLSVDDWRLARAALQRRVVFESSPNSTRGPFTSWSPRQRILRIAWCAVTAGDASPLIGTHYSSLAPLIDAWAHFTCPFRLSNDLAGKLRLHNKPTCVFASCKVGVWQWFRAAVLDYTSTSAEAAVEDVIGCCERCVSRALPTADVTPIASPVDRPAVWLVLVWVAFQIQAARTGQTTADLLSVVDYRRRKKLRRQGRRAGFASNARAPAGQLYDAEFADLTSWDLEDERYLRNALEPFTAPVSGAAISWMEPYPPSWRPFLEMLDSQGWAALETATFRPSRARSMQIPVEDEHTMRIGTLVLWTTSALHASDSATELDKAALLDFARFCFPSKTIISTSFRVPLPDIPGFFRFLIDNPRFPPRSDARKTRQYDLNLSTETVNWHCPHEWLAESRAQLREALVLDQGRTNGVGAGLEGVVEVLYWVWMSSPGMPLRFASSVFMHLLSQGESDALRELRACFSAWSTWNALTSLINFRSSLGVIIALAKNIKDGGLPTTLINVLIHTDILCVCAQITQVLKDPVLYEDFLNSDGDDAQKLLDLIQDLLDYPLLHERVRPVILKALLKLSSKSKLHPRSFALFDRLHLDGHPVTAGAFGDVWKGEIHNEVVAVKVMRVYLDHDVEALLNEISHEGLIWRQLSHPNLLPFFGAYYLDGGHGRVGLVSPWMENGDVASYLKANPDVDRLSLTLDIALGLEHLHSLKLVHGDLKAVNILITQSGRAVLADFGLSSVTESKIMTGTSSSGRKAAGTVRWQAPELFSGGKNSFASDVYAFAGVCYEIFTGNVPFFEITRDVAVMLHVIQGHRPERPSSSSPHPIPDALWSLMQECWHAEPTDRRPTAAQIIFTLRDSPLGAVRNDPVSDWDPLSTSKFRSSLEEHTLFLSCGAVEDWVRFVRRPKANGDGGAAEAFLSARHASAAIRDV
ncbi:hypothetical protein HMN09_00368200 [Mycena chlorophos]|uniref:Protein kinase domain-containing protein n=1 Tax=Mycena chlorophos TaxID=658473 RepID=A0A8H6TIY7_MYCCL|nr:hypothetical protein HMN09_00368200 [Mycena chlorophos]